MGHFQIGGESGEPNRKGGGGGGGGGVFITITVTEEARTTRFRVAPARASPRCRENLSEDPAARVLLHCGVPYAPKLLGPRPPLARERVAARETCGSSLAWWNRLTTILTGALRLS